MLGFGFMIDHPLCLNRFIKIKIVIRYSKTYLLRQISYLQSIGAKGGPGIHQSLSQNREIHSNQITMSRV